MPVQTRSGLQSDLRGATQADLRPNVRRLNPDEYSFGNFIGGLMRREGGYVNHPADRGGATNFGISSRAHPGVDVANLTQQDAADIYKRDYWDAIGADQLPPESREVAFDLAVNSGVGFAKKAIQATGADPAAMIDYQKQHYANIIKNDPSQQVFEKGWSNRMARLSSGGGQGGGQTYDATPQRPQPGQAQGQQMQVQGMSEQDRYQQMLQGEIDDLAPDPLRDMGRAMAGGFARQKPYQGMSAGAGFANAFSAGSAISGKKRMQMSRLQLQMQRLKVEEERRETDYQRQQANSDRSYQLQREQFGYKVGEDARDNQLQQEQFQYKQNQDALKIEREGGARPAALPGGYKDWGSVATVVNPMRDDYVRDIADYKSYRKGAKNVTSLIERKPDLSTWKATDGAIAVTTLQKMIDPTSQVTQGDMETMSQGGSAKAQIWSSILKYTDGKTEIPEDELRSIINNIYTLYNGHIEDAKRLESGYVMRANNMGLEGNQVFTPLSWPDPQLLLDETEQGRGVTPDISDDDSLPPPDGRFQPTMNNRGGRGR